MADNKCATGTQVNRVLCAIGAVPFLDENVSTQRLQAAFLSTGGMSGLRDHFANPYQQQSNCSFDGIDLSDHITSLGNASLAAQLARIDSSYGFNTLSDHDKAYAVPDTSFRKIMPCLYAEHINEQLAKASLPSLRALRNDSNFVENFKSWVTGRLCDPESGRPDNHYAMTVLFVYEYFTLGPGFELTTNILETQAADVLLNHWVPKTKNTALAGNLEEQVALATSIVMTFCHAASAVMLPDSKASSSMTAFASTLEQHHGLVQQVASSFTTDVANNLTTNLRQAKIFDEPNLKEYQSVVYRLWDKWTATVNDQSTDNFWRSGIAAAEQVCRTVRTNVGRALIKYDVYGQPIVDWYAANKGASYIVSSPDLHNRVQEPEFPSGSCFIPDTKITTDGGEIAVQNIVEGQRILTRAGSATQWGVASDEVVEINAPTEIFGFNGESPFVTAGHVFSTTTGLRAISPALAKLENPWLEVGTLRVGHQLYKLNEFNAGYDIVQVKSINRSPCDARYVYGVHLREGLRSYHANGYLVRMNYPEITVKSVATQLQKLSADQRLQCLAGLQELQPLFRRFGIDTVTDRLVQEARQARPLEYGGKRNQVNTVNTRDLYMPYVMRELGQSKGLISVELHAGVLRIDGKVCHHTKFDKDELWFSHQQSDQTWLHAACRFFGSGLKARGLMLVTDRETDNRAVALSSPSWELRSKVKHFTLVPGTPTTVGVSLSVTAAKDLQNDPGSDYDDILFPLKYDLNPLVNGVTPNCTQSCGTALLPITENDDILWPRLHLDDFDKVAAKLKEAAAAEVNNIHNLDVSAMRSFYDYTVAYDAENIETHNYVLRSPQIFIQCSDEYDDFVAAHPDHLDLEPPTTNLHFVKKLKMPADFVLARVFKTIQIKVQEAGHALTGYVRPYSVFDDGNQSKMHGLTGAVLSTRLAPLRQVMKDAISYRAFPDLGEADVHGLKVPDQHQSFDPDVDLIHGSPHPVAFALSAVQDDASTLDSLIHISYDNRAVNESARVMMTNVMQWHMDDGQRKLFFNASSKPDGLPSELTDNLDSESKTWLQKVYAPAYISSMLAQNEKLMSTPFKDKEKKRIRYFWTGKGAGTLAASTVYKKLDRAIQRACLRRKYPVVGKVHDDGNGVKFSNMIYDHYTKDQIAWSSITSQVDAQTQTAIVTKTCAIMDALDGGADVDRDVYLQYKTAKHDAVTVHMKDTNSNAISIKVIAKHKGAVWTQQWWGSSQTLKADDQQLQRLEMQWLQDCLQDMLQKIIDGDPDVAGDVAERLSKEIEENSKQVANWAQLDSKAKAQQVMLSMATDLPDFVNGMAVAFGWIRSGTGWIIDKGKAAIAAWKTGSARVTEAAEAVAAKKTNPTGFVKGPLMKSLFVLVGMVALGVTIWQISDHWSGADDLLRGLMIISVFGAFRQLADLGVDAVDAVMRWGRSAYSERVQLALTERLDQFMEESLSSEAALMDPGIRGGGYFAPNKWLQVEAKFAAEMETKASTVIEEGAQGTLPEVMAMGRAIVAIRRAFNIARQVLAVLGYFVSVGIAVYMTWQLITGWKDMSTGQRIFQTIQTVLALIEAIGAVVMLVSYAAWGVATVVGAGCATTIGLFVAAASTVFAAVMMVVAVVAILVMIIYFIWESKQDPQPTEIDKYVSNTAQPWVAGIVIPDCPIDLSINRTTYQGSSPSLNVVELKIKNTSSQAVTSQATNFKITKGKDSSCLFYEAGGMVDNPDLTLPGHVTMETASGSNSKALMRVVSTPSETTDKITNVSVTVEGPEVEDEKTGLTSTDLVLSPGEEIKVRMSGSVWDPDHKDCSVSWTQFWQEDSWSDYFVVSRPN